MEDSRHSPGSADLAVNFETHPSNYKHLELSIEGPIATVALNIAEDQGLRPDYELKLNSYDLSVDIELADAVQRLRFEHPEVSVVIITSALEGAFSAGANIFMLGTSSHAFKVNFCRYTNETRLYIEDASQNSEQFYIAALNGVASGGGYELPLACDEIYLVDDRRSAVSLPEIPYLGVLPGTGGITRVVDKRHVRKDRADVFLTLAEGIKGKKAAKWNLVDGVYPLSKFDSKIQARAAELVEEINKDPAKLRGVQLEALEPEVDEQGIHYKFVDLVFADTPRVANLTITLPEDLPDIPDDPSTLGSGWWPLRAFRELDNALLRLRFNYPDIGLVLVRTRGSLDSMTKLDKDLCNHHEHWFVNEVVHNMKRVLKRMDYTAKSFFALIDQGSCFGGSLFELALAADRAYIFDDENTSVMLTDLNFGPLPMGNRLSRLATRFLGEPDTEHQLRERLNERFDGPEAEEIGLVLASYDDIDWDDEIRLAVEERASMSPDALTGMEANVRFAGPETIETKIFGRLSAWQNWIFQRPNAVGKKGALTLYGRPESPEFDWRRT